jgi:Ca2+/Na+ antiporter
MTGGDFYSASQQIKREFFWLWRTNGRAILLATVFYVLPSFFLFQPLGRSQVYEAVLPFAVVAIVLFYHIYRAASVQLRGKTAAFYTNLPRNPATALMAELCYYVLVCALMEAVVFLGIFIKLGGGGITPQFRIYPECVVLPLLSTAAALWWTHGPPSRNRDCALTALALPAVAWVIGIILPRYPATVKNNYIPPTVQPLSIQMFIAAIALAAAAMLAYALLRNARRNPGGER